MAKPKRRGSDGARNAFLGRVPNRSAQVSSNEVGASTGLGPFFTTRDEGTLRGGGFNSKPSSRRIRAL